MLLKKESLREHEKSDSKSDYYDSEVIKNHESSSAIIVEHDNDDTHDRA